MNNRLYKNLECYLKPEAQQALDTLKGQGLDPDLAFVLLEELAGEDIYDELLPEPGNE